MNKVKCKDCNNKGWYSQMFGKHYSADFEGDKSFTTKPKIHKVACPTCNFRNKRTLKDVIKSQMYAD